MATLKEKIVGLYIAFFNRAGDEEGLNYWENQASILGEDRAISKLAEGFASHPKFTDLYSELNNREFVEAIYKNTLGKAGDSEGIDYWTTRLDSGMSRSDMVADFISISLDFNPDEPQYANLSKEEIAIALSRQALIENKVAVSLDYIGTLKSRTDLNPQTDPSDPSSLDKDPAFKASIKILENITDNRDTVNRVEEALDLLQDRDDAIDILNRVDIINRDTISNEINSDTQPTNPSLSHTNYGLGDISTLDSTGVASLDSTVHWDRKELTYSFNHSIPDSYYNYPDETLTTNWHELNQAQKDTVNSITREINSLLDIKLIRVADGGDIRFNMVDMPENQAGFSFYPADDPDYGGDVFLSNGFNSDPQNYRLDRGNGGWTTIVHELGHALGLKHPFEEPNRLPSNQDDINHTVMSYTLRDNIVPIFTTEGSSIKLEYHLLYPNLYSLYDVSALQAIYGANTTTNNKDNIYTTKYSNYEIQTIWDTGGDDTIDLSDTKGRTVIDLRGGTINSVDEYSLEDIIKLHQDEVGNPEANSWIRDKITKIYNHGMLYTGKNNFSIAEGVIIENIKTGSEDDIVIDNSVDNSIYTNGGDDRIYIGNGGYDYINGGTGEDTLYIDLTKDKIKVEQGSSGDYILTADSFGAELVGVERVYLSDDIYNIEDLIV